MILRGTTLVIFQMEYLLKKPISFLWYNGQNPYFPTADSVSENLLRSVYSISHFHTGFHLLRLSAMKTLDIFLSVKAFFRLNFFSEVQTFY